MSKEFLGSLMGMMDEKDKRRNIMKLPFSYPGSKFADLPEILPELPYRKKYAEAFGGSGIVLLNRSPSDLEILNDRYMGVTSLYRVVRNPIELRKLLERLELVLHSREEFIWCKSTWKDCNDDLERAARWYYIVNFAVNSKPESTFGRAINANARITDKYYNQLKLFWPLHERLKWTVQIENLDWRTLLNDYDCEEMVWYLDPTYLGSHKAYEFMMTEDDHVELCERIFKLKGFVALSGYDNHETRRIYDSYNWTRKKTWTRKSKMLVHCDQMFNAVETDMNRIHNVVNEALWILE